VTVVDLPWLGRDGGRSALARPWRWSIRPGSAVTVVDPPWLGRDGGRSAPSRPRWWPLCRHFAGVS